MGSVTSHQFHFIHEIISEDLNFLFLWMDYSKHIWPQSDHMTWHQDKGKVYTRSTDTSLLIFEVWYCRLITMKSMNLFCVQMNFSCRLMLNSSFWGNTVLKWVFLFSPALMKRRSYLINWCGLQHTSCLLDTRHKVANPSSHPSSNNMFGTDQHHTCTWLQIHVLEIS